MWMNPMGRRAGCFGSSDAAGPMTTTSTECPILCSLVAASKRTCPPFRSQSIPIKPSLSGDRAPSHAAGAGTEASSMFAPGRMTRTFSGDIP